MSDAAAGAGPEVELKYLLPQARAGFVLRWLEGVAAPERAHPPALVVTTYYDTPGFDLLAEKVDSDFLKTKVRVRWYAPLDGGPPASPAFVEAKSREGGTRRKRRLRLNEPARQLAALPLDDRMWTDLVAGLRTELPALPDGLAPVLRLAYVRHRFTDPRGARISVDTGIGVEAVSHARLHAPARGGTLPWSVFELKAHASDLPGHLAPVTRFGARRSSFSKYLACYEHVTRRAF
jgi:hypothetical protein